jgi:tetratricopeptide (TPR) repeat protein
MSKPLIFSRDGRLLMCSEDRNSISVTNLGRLQTELTELGLPWNISIEPGLETADKLCEFEFDCGTIPAEAQTAENGRKARALAQSARSRASAKDYDRSMEEFQQAIDLAPDEAITLNNYAWLLVTCPDTTKWDAEKALALARRAEKLSPDSSTIVNTLGIALYRCRQWNESIETLLRAEQLEPSSYYGFNGFFLSMAHRQLGHQEEAQKWLDQSVRWMEKNQPKDDELIRFRQEAELLIGEPALVDPDAPPRPKAR